MNNVVPMRRPASLRSKTNNTLHTVRELDFPMGVTLSELLPWITLAVYFGAIVLGVFAVVVALGIGIGSILHFNQPSLVTSCVPSRGLVAPDIQEQIRKAA